MIQYPTNVKPCNYAFDANVQSGESTIQFTFNGDVLTNVIYKIFDYNTGELAYQTAYNYSTKYNESDVSHSIPAGTLTNGKNYVLQMQLCQNKGDTHICDMPVIGGKIEATDSTSATKLYIESDITSIYSFNENNGVYAPSAYGFDSTIIKIGNETRKIVSYTASVTIDENTTLGCIEIDRAFTNVSVGSYFEIYSNFIVSQQYYFSCRTTPTVTFSHSFSGDYLYCKGEYSQAENSAIKYYSLKLYWSNNESFYPETVSNMGYQCLVRGETNKIYSQNIEHEFWYSNYHDEKFNYGTNDYYKIVCEVVTQDNMTCTFESDVMQVEAKTIPDNTGLNLYGYKLSWNKELGCITHAVDSYRGTVSAYYLVFREDLNTGETVTLLPHFVGYKSGYLYGYDMTASTHGDYKYTLKMFDKNGSVVFPNKTEAYDGDDVFPTATIHTSECAYYITELNIREDIDRKYHPNHSTNRKVQFTTGDTWKFAGEIQDTTVTNNLDRMTHVGYGQYVSSTSTNVNYMSGTLSAMIGYVNCMTKEYIDDITLVRAWRKFITQNKPFLLKSQKGDVWVVNITDNPTTTYQENYHKIPTTISFTWAESYNIDGIEIFNESISEDDIEVVSKTTE